jgi:cytidylate kinase
MKIAMDGPGGAGKSSAAKAAAERLGFHYVDTGAIYRSLGCSLVRAGVPIEDEAAVEKAIADAKVEVFYNDQGQQVWVNGEDMAPYIRTPEAGEAASRTSAYPAVRAKLLQLQQDLGRKYDVIMDGRDIGTVVLPDADLKLFITADPAERGRRRYRELLDKGETKITLEQVTEDIRRRDERDRNRPIAPLRQADDAILLDTTTMSLEEVIDRICMMVKARSDQA